MERRRHQSDYLPGAALTLDRRQLLRLSALGAAALGVGGLAACSDDASPDGGDAGTLPKTLTIAVPEEQAGFDSDIAGGTYNITDHIFDPLVIVDPTNKIIPWLALSWENPDDRTWRFKLREGVTFSNGEPFDATAVKYSLERIVDPSIKGITASRWKSYGHFDHVEVVDAHTVDVKTTAPTPLMLPLLTRFNMRPPKYYASTPLDKLREAPIGSGPYTLAAWDRAEQRVELAANPTYWAGAPAVETLVWRVIPEADTRISELVTGGVQICQAILPDQIAQVETDSTQVSQVDGGRIVSITMATDNPSLPTSNVKVRQAMNYAANVDAVCASLLGGTTKPYGGPITEPNNDPSLSPYANDLAKAKQLMAEAGYAGGFTIDMDTCTDRYLKDVEVVQAVAQNLGQIGITVNIKTWDWTTYLKRLQEGPRAPMYLLGQGGFDDSFEELSRVFDVRSAIYKGSGWRNPDFGANLDRAAQTIDPKQHLDDLWAAQRILWDEAPAIFMYHEPVLFGVQKGLPWKARKSERILLHWTVIPALRPA